MTQAEFKAVEDAAVRSAIELQQGAGIDVVTDGELRRYAFYGNLIDAFEGFDREGGWAIPWSIACAGSEACAARSGRFSDRRPAALAR